MTMQQGADAYDKAHTPASKRPVDAAELRRSGVARGAAMYRASRRDRAAREALDAIADDQPSDRE